MISNGSRVGGRRPHQVLLSSDLVVVGGGMAGICCSITAARQGLRVLLLQDRSVLGGNASSEVRLWILGATSHMGNNNRWAREGGVIDEILVENVWRNPEGNPVIFDSLLLEWVTREPNITLMLNSAVSEVELNEDGSIRSAIAFCSQNETSYRCEAPLFCDASGDGILGFLAGASFRMGAEATSEFGERLAGPHPVHELLGSSLYFYSRDTGRPVTFIPPAFALKDINRIPRYRELRVSDSGCRLWWLEWGGTLDTVHAAEEIKWELWRIAYGVWNYIKNSGQFPEAANLTLEWMGMLPGKRESRRFEGDYILRQQDIVAQRNHFDAVSYGGWAIDLHPAEGVYSSEPGCTQWHAKGVYQIPWRSLYSRDVPNLFLAGRIISATHIAFGSTRVMATCAHNAQAVGIGAALCTEYGVQPRGLLDRALLGSLQQRLLRAGQHIPGIRSVDPEDKASRAKIEASSARMLHKLESSGETRLADQSCALLLPMLPGPAPSFTFLADASEPSVVRAELWRSSQEGNTTPDVKLAQTQIHLKPGKLIPVELQFDVSLDEPCHVFVILSPANGVSLYLSQEYLPGVLTVSQKMNRSVAKSPIQCPPEGSGIDSFPFWLPERRPSARNLAVQIHPPIACFSADMVVNGWARPWCGANCWIPEKNDTATWLCLKWDQPQTLSRIEVTFDTDFDHPMESVLMGHNERVMPGCVSDFSIESDSGRTLACVRDNHQTRWACDLPDPVTTRSIKLVISRWAAASPAVFEVRCY